MTLQPDADTSPDLTAVYVLHFDPPFKHAHHYVGFTTHADVATRLDEHMKGAGSRLVRAVARAGHAVHIAHVFIGADRRFERQIKNRKDVSRWCRICARNERAKPKMNREDVQR
jgi:predicted GIY-YIG superfamily endonuclease